MTAAANLSRHQLPDESLGDLGVDPEVRVTNLGSENAAAGVDASESAAILEWQLELHANQTLRRESGVNPGEEFVETRALERGDANAGTIGMSGEHLRREAVALVEDVEARAIGKAEFVENLDHFRVLLGMIRIGEVGDVKDESGFLRLFQSGAKRSDEAGGKVADETDGVRKQGAMAGRQVDNADGGIERGEHA